MKPWRRGIIPDDRRIAFPGAKTADDLIGARRTFLLSPADATGKRAHKLIAATSDKESDLVRRLRGGGVELGEVFTSISTLYFRGQLAYAAAFSGPPTHLPSTLIIPSCGGLLEPKTLVTLADVTSLSQTRIRGDDSAFRDPLERDLRRLSEELGSDGRAIFLGSLATRKYVPLLLDVLGHRLYVPRLFLGAGNMRRGFLLLQSVCEGRELDYISARNAL